MRDSKAATAPEALESAEPESGVTFGSEASIAERLAFLERLRTFRASMSSASGGRGDESDWLG